MSTTRRPRAPYDLNNATLPSEETSNARNYGGDKETIDSLRVIVFDQGHRTHLRKQNRTNGYPHRPDEGFTTAIDARWYMGRSGGASVVYCSVWIRTVDGKGYAGHGSAGGYGYHKQSAAFDSALRSAGIELGASVSGCGDGPMRKACVAILKACGFGRLPHVFA